MFHPEGPSVLELTNQWLSSTQRGYDLLAPKFDYTPFRTPDSVLSIVREHIMPFAPLNSLLDLCCGTGAAIQALEGLYDHAVGIDFSRGMLDVAGKGAEKRAVDGKSLRLTHLSKVMFPEDGFTKAELLLYYQTVAPLSCPTCGGGH